MPETQTLSARPILSGKAAQSVSLPASHGSYSMELHFALTNDSQSTSTNDKGDVTVAVTAADKWAPNPNSGDTIFNYSLTCDQMNLN